MKYILIFHGISSFCFAQKFSFIYETKYKLKSDKPDEINLDHMILDLENNIPYLESHKTKNPIQ